ncbi:hypothetical protein PPYR_06038 [Photinus pyralis]|uniref:ELMO domain-containing protein n=1 Tax=Photinus pyralis TaxID=7054 RepID=A0A5N4ASU9_PHOPY|nr:engulfment and cell motility protein 1-like [Photinus pyralis]KAB0800298.1 hypothetical protein PPYR_06038 [Photinus pyralis]
MVSWDIPQREEIFFNAFSLKMDAKIGIEINGTQLLFKINKQKSLKENIDCVCAENNLGPGENYGFKFSYTAQRSNEGNYVTEDNFQTIQNGCTLKLVESLDKLIDRIFDNINHNRSQSVQDLYSLSTDPGFIKLMVEKKRDADILEWVTNENLCGKELSVSLLILLHLLKKQYIKELPSIMVENIIKWVKSTLITTNQIQYALAVLCQILYLRGHALNKQTIILGLSIDDIISFISRQELSQLQLNTMMLINAMVKNLRGDKRQHLIKDLNRSKNKEYIFTYIIKKSKIDPGMARELYAYQTYILSVYSTSLNTPFYTVDNPMLREFELYDDKLARSSTYVDLEEICRNRSNSTGTILEDIDDVRISIASGDSGISDHVDRLTTSMSEHHISLLTYEALVHYKKYHYKNFCQSRIEENTYEPGIYVSSDKITRLLANILHIGMEPTRSGDSYHPLVFNTSLKFPFFLELFSRSMWLLSKTRKEMRAWSYDDYSKVLLVLEKQVKMALAEKPMDYASLTAEMMKVTYEEVDKQWQHEKQNEWERIYQSNPNVQILKQKFSSHNEQLIFESRMRTLQSGELFPKLPEKKGKQQYCFIRLSENRRMIIWGAWNENLKNFKAEEPERFNVEEIKHFVIGKACPHVKDNSIKNPERAFSIILEDGTVINLLAKDVKVANLWIDGFSLLLDKPHRSEEYRKDLETLLEMDCALHLLELQHVSLPDTAPIIPALPAPIRLKTDTSTKLPPPKLRKQAINIQQ